MNSNEKKKRPFRHSSSFYYRLKKVKSQAKEGLPFSTSSIDPNLPSCSTQSSLPLSETNERVELDVPLMNLASVLPILNTVDSDKKLHTSGISDASSDLSDQDFEQQISSNKDLKNTLREWALENKITHTALNSLLKILKASGHTELPFDARTLLHTPTRSVSLMKIGTGEYWYNGISKNIILALTQLDEIGIDIPISLSIIINIDGLPPYKSSCIEFWPILFRISEVRGPPMTAAVFCGDTKPPLEDFLRPFVSELNELTETGLRMTIKGQETILPVQIKYIVCDTPARSFIKGVVGFNSYHGCIKCTTVGEYDRDGRHMSFPNTNCSLRTDESFRKKLDEDHHKENSPLLDLNINMVDQIIIADSLHLLDLGIMRKCLYGWVYGTYNFKKNKLSAREILQMSEKLMQVNMTKPNDIHRSIRSLRALKNWKGVEYRTVLLYLGPVIFKEFLSSEVYHNFLVLHVAVTILSCNYYSCYISVADQLLKDYIEQYKRLYGYDSIGSNVHNLSHIVKDVKNFGNLSELSSYIFENFLGRIKLLLRSGNRPLAQVANRIQELQSCNITESQKSKVILKDAINYEGRQVFKTLLLNNVILRADKKNRWFLTTNKKIVSIIYAVKEINNIIIYGAPVKSLSDLYNLPIKSSMINEYKSSKVRSSPEFFKLEDIKCKLFCIDSGEEFAFIPLNHTLDLFNTKF